MWKTYEELYQQTPDGVPEWFVNVMRSIKVADHLGDVWDALLVWPPEEWKSWIRDVCDAEYDNERDEYWIW